MIPIPSQISRRGQWLVLTAAFLGWMFDGLEMGIFPLVARPALKEFLQHTTADPKILEGLIGHWMGYVTALFLIGAACGGFIFGWLGDRIGRVRAMSLSILTYSVFSGLCYFAAEPWHLGALRFVSALGMGGEWSLGVALVMESWPREKRPMLAGIIGAAANLGFVLIAVVGLGFKVTQDSWRWVMIAGAAPALLTFLIQIFVPESESWKESVKKSGVTNPLAAIFSPPFRKTTLLAIVFASVALIGTWASVQWLPLWADQMTLGKLPSAKANTQILTGLGAMAGCVAGGWVAGRLNRRPAFFGLCCLSLLTCQALYRSVSEYGTVFLMFVFLAGFFTAAFYGWFPLYFSELFPTRIRATGQGVSYNSGRVLAAFGALGQGELMKSFGGSYSRAGIVITSVYLVGMALIWIAPETRNHPVPD